MKPAAVALLPFPTSALTTADSMDWIKSNWNWTSGTSEFLNFVVDPFGGGKIVLRVRYPKSSYAHEVAGGVTGFYLDVFDGANPLRALLSYQVAFSTNFDFVKGGKLPGLYGGDHSGGCWGGVNSDLCFSLRVYAYLPGTTPAFCASPLVSCSTSTYGTSLGRSTWNYTSLGAWSTVVESAVLNSDPSIDGAGTARANGYISTYFNPSGEDAKLAFTKKGIVFRTREEVGFSKLFFSTFFGGGSVDYASTRDVYAYFKDFNIYQGTGDSNASGDVVTVS
ncbi:hypothetical protein BCR35DRAFT_173071 [Leucosporidium creatinivorum]|uniref:Polysaccharide lyase 14 domain-containing protein n=1 Tax=Leucosporidium creatinivorum TaxID=106004 RepID=A0A1Y2FYT4_9BASI|nr:hypothetical protein BCR35DRAFT_173071 [Leucosporidium creatinivorum]